MGSYNRWYVTCNAEGAQLEKILNDRVSFDEAGDPWHRFCFRKWSERTKWWPDDIIKELSKRHPEIIFMVRGHGESSNGQAEYYYAGELYEERDVFPHPTFPPVERFAQVKNELAEQEKAKLVAVEKQKEYRAAMEQQNNLGE